MKKYLFLSNSTYDEKLYNSKDKYFISTMEQIPVSVALEMGYEVYIGVNRKYATQLECNNQRVHLWNVEIYRNPFDFFGLKKAYKNIMELLRKGDFEVIHCNTPIGGTLGRICGKKANINKVIYTAHGFHFYKDAPMINNIVYKAVEKVLAHYTDVIITMNEEDYNESLKLRLRDDGNYYYMHGVGIDLEQYREVKLNKAELRRNLGLKKDDFICISVGDIIHRKNYEMAIEAISKCNNKKIYYLVCGTGDYLDYLQELCKRKNIEDQVLFLGYRKDIKELMKISDVFVLTSKQEGLPRSLMEAMACGLPCIVTNIRGNNDLIKNNMGGKLVEINDEKMLSSVLIEVMNNVEERKRMSFYNLQTIERYSDKVVKEEVKKIYLNELDS